MDGGSQIILDARDRRHDLTNIAPLQQIGDLANNLASQNWIEGFADA